MSAWESKECLSNLKGAGGDLQNVQAKCLVCVLSVLSVLSLSLSVRLSVRGRWVGWSSPSLVGILHLSPSAETQAHSPQPAAPSFSPLLPSTHSLAISRRFARALVISFRRRLVPR